MIKFLNISICNIQFSSLSRPSGYLSSKIDFSHECEYITIDEHVQPGSILRVGVNHMKDYKIRSRYVYSIFSTAARRKKYKKNQEKGFDLCKKHASYFALTLCAETCALISQAFVRFLRKDALGLYWQQGRIYLTDRVVKF